MARSYFAVRFSSQTFEHYSGIGYREEGGRPEQYLPLNEADFGMFLGFSSYIEDENGKVIGCRFKNYEDKSLHEVYPGKVHSISVWTTAVDDDGCPEDICIDYYIELIPCSE